jgi:hypothetical protein
MPQNATITGPANTWMLGTNADVVAARYQNMGAGILYVQATVGPLAEPADLSGAIKYGPGLGQVRTSLLDLFEGVPGANRIWFFSDMLLFVSISHD